MTVSLPSKEIHSVDIPEVNDFIADFHYNFFVSDESLNDTGNVPTSVLTRESTSGVSQDFIQFATMKVPRFVVFKFTPVHLRLNGRKATDSDGRHIRFGANNRPGFLTEHIAKLVTEDHFASHDFTSLSFHDANLDEKVYQLVSGSIQQHQLGHAINPNVSNIRAADSFLAWIPKNIKPHFVVTQMADKKKTNNTQTFRNPAAEALMKRHGRRHASSSSTKSTGHKKFKIVNVDKLRFVNVNVNAQLNSKLIQDVLGRTIQDPLSPYTSELRNMFTAASSVQHRARQKLPILSVNEFRTIVPYVSLKVSNSVATQSVKTEIVGYVIDKFEHLANGETLQHAPLIIEGQDVGSYIDFNVKYGSNYTYQIRSAALVTLPVIDSDSGNIVILELLISSRPSRKSHVHTIDDVAPPPPADFNLTWNYETDKLMLHWAFPPNSQRDIKKFQVFRRKSVNEPFELLKMYDFDDSQVRYGNTERPDQALVEYISSPSANYIDDDFNKESSNFIYAVACIDAHGFTSNYSAQFEITFDRFKNRLMKRLISHAGAPKPYPNLYLEADLCVDVMKISGPSSKQLKVYFNPQYYTLIDDSYRTIDTFAAKNEGGNYRLQFINIDNQKSTTVNLQLDDRRSHLSVQHIKTLSFHAAK